MKFEIETSGKIVKCKVSLEDKKESIYRNGLVAVMSIIDTILKNTEAKSDDVKEVLTNYLEDAKKEEDAKEEDSKTSYEDAKDELKSKEKELEALLEELVNFIKGVQNEDK